MKIIITYSGTVKEHEEAIHDFERAYNKVVVSVCEKILKEK